MEVIDTNKDVPQLFASLYMEGDEIVCELHDSDAAAHDRMEEFFATFEEDEVAEPCSSFVANSPDDEEDFVIVPVAGVRNEEGESVAHVVIRGTPDSTLKESRVEVTVYRSCGHLPVDLILYMHGSTAVTSSDGMRTDYVAPCSADWVERIGVDSAMEALYEFATHAR